MEMGLCFRVECSGTDAGCADTHWNDPLVAVLGIVWSLPISPAHGRAAEGSWRPLLADLLPLFLPWHPAGRLVLATRKQRLTEVRGRQGWILQTHHHLLVLRGTPSPSPPWSASVSWSSRQRRMTFLIQGM